MATANEIATKALRRLRIVASNQDPAAADQEAAVDALNSMIASWEAYGLSGDVLPLAARFEHGITAMLAVRLAEEYAVPIGPVLARDARDGWQTLVAAFHVVKPMTYEAGVQTGYWGFRQLDTSDAADYEAWRASTDYALYTCVYNAGNVYECTTAGTSGSSGPSGTGDAITDGTVTWIWRRASFT